MSDPGGHTWLGDLLDRGLAAIDSALQGTEITAKDYESHAPVRDLYGIGLRSWENLRAAHDVFARENPNHGVIAVGGALDSATGLVRDLLESFGARAAETAYRGWNATDLGSLISGMRERLGAVLGIGHSYGASTLANVVAQGTKIDMMISIDPVGSTAPYGLSTEAYMSAIAENTGTWAVVTANQDIVSWNNIVAVLGGRWGDVARLHADISVIGTQDHAGIVRELRNELGLP